MGLQHYQRALVSTEPIPALTASWYTVAVVLMTTQQAVINANLSFYEAFSAQDYEAMLKVWSTREDICCLHPGWPIVRGREAVLSSWRAILEASAGAGVRCEGARPTLLDQAAIVTCVEQVDRSRLVATNTFALEDGVWRMVHHQAGTFSEVTVTTEPPPPKHRLN